MFEVIYKLSNRVIYGAGEWLPKEAMSYVNATVKNMLHAFVELNGQDYKAFAQAAESKFNEMNPDNNEAKKEFRAFLIDTAEKLSNDRKEAFGKACKALYEH